jgi:hypothetical protein
VTPSYDTSKAIASADQFNASEFLQAIATTTEATTTDPTPDSPSKRISQSIFANVAYLEQNGSIDDNAKQAIVDNAIDQIQDSFSFKQYDVAGLKVISNENDSTLRAYGSQFASHQVSMILTMQKRVGEIENDISVMADIYAKEAENLYELQVPAALVDTHMQIVNDFSRSAAAFRAIANEKKDPLQVPIAMSVYQTANEQSASLMTKIATYLRANGIIYSKSEAGAYWNAFLSQDQ